MQFEITVMRLFSRRLIVLLKENDMIDIKQRLDLLKERIQTRDFLEGKGLSNEVNILMFCFAAEDEMVVRHFVEQLSFDQNLACNLKVYNLYDIYISLCEDLDILDAIPEMEGSDGSDYLLEQLHCAIGNNDFIQKMQYSDHKVGDVIMLSGIGEVFPFMRVHKLLEAMQPHFSNVPIVVMYPGTFDGHSMQLFNKLRPNDYYRAFNVI